MFYFALMLAGGSGVLLRYLLVRLTVNLQWTALPFGTLLANLIGSFVMGYLSWVLLHKWQVSKEMQVIILSGFLGGFTTFSAFSIEVVAFYQQGLHGRMLLYLISSVLLSIVFCFLGLLMARN